MKKWTVYKQINQPLLCTYVTKKIFSNKKNLILYTPRNQLDGSVVCHIGEVHLKDKAKGEILNHII